MDFYTLDQAAAMALGSVKRKRPARSGASNRTGAPVLRGSIEAGTFEDMFFAVPGKGETDRLLRQARAALDTGRRLKRAARSEGRGLTAAERPIAALTAGTVRVYETLLTLARLNRGRVYPSYDYLAEATALGRATIARALSLLEAAGFLIKQRRFKKVDAQGPGPRYHQTSNAYRPAEPHGISRFLPRWMRPAPLPDDVVVHEAERIEALGHMRAGLSCRELAEHMADGALGKMLARLGASLDGPQRESQNHPQPQSKFIKQGSIEISLVGQPRSA